MLQRRPVQKYQFFTVDVPERSLPLMAVEVSPSCSVKSVSPVMVTEAISEPTICSSKAADLVPEYTAAPPEDPESAATPLETSDSTLSLPHKPRKRKFCAVLQSTVLPQSIPEEESPVSAPAPEHGPVSAPAPKKIPVSAPAPKHSPVSAPAPKHSPVSAPAPEHSPVSAPTPELSQSSNL